MTNSQRLAEVRDRLCDWIAQQPDEAQGESATAEIVGESILIVDGFYCGRRFDAGRYYAIWFMEEDELKIHADGGDLLRVFAGEELSQINDAVEPAGEEAVREDESEDESVADVISLPHLDADEPEEDEIRRAA